MINSLSMDVEIFNNLFSITFVDLRDYLNKFKDCVDAKGKPKALTECLTVEEMIDFMISTCLLNPISPFLYAT